MSAPPPSYSPPSYPPIPRPELPSSSPSSLSAPSAKSTGIQLTHDAEVLIQMYVPPPLSANAPPYHSRDLPLPFCVPQMSASANSESAFARGYNEALGEVGITQEMMLNFIDGLNLAINASPPLRVVNVAGSIVGFVPNHWAMIAGTVMQTSAQIGIRILSKTLTDRYLRAANINLFKPRGLSVRLCTTPAMLRLISNNASNSSGKSKTQETLDKIGRGVGTVFMRLPIPIVAPLASRVIHSLADKPPTISPTGRPGDPIDPSSSPVLLRRLALIANIALPLEARGMPPPAKPRNVMDMISSWGVQLDARSEAKTAKKMEERRRAWAQIQAAGIRGQNGARSPLLSPLPSPRVREQERQWRTSHPSPPSSSSSSFSPSPSPPPSSSSMPMPTPKAASSGLASGSGYGDNMPMDRRTARQAYKEAKREIRAERKAEKEREKDTKRDIRAERKAEKEREKDTKREIRAEHWADKGTEKEAKRQNHAERKANKEMEKEAKREIRAERKANKGMEKEAKREIRAEHRAHRGLEKEARREMRAERKAERKARKAQRIGLLSGMSKVERRIANANLLEYWATNRILWIVVMHTEKDADIEDIAIAEDPSNEERVDEESWRQEMEFERDDLEDDIESEEEWEKEQIEEDDEAEEHWLDSHTQKSSSFGSKS